ncbi:MAG: membrane protein insertase YidC, partial [Myxococcales bacterium FL481]
MNEMSFKQRLWLTIAACLAIVWVQSLFAPPMSDAPDAGSGSTGAEEAGRRGAAVADAPPGGGGPGAEPVAVVEAATEAATTATYAARSQRIVNDAEKLAIDATNSGGGLVAHVEPLGAQFREPDGRGLDFVELDGLAQTLQVDLDPARSDVQLAEGGYLEVIEASESAFSVRRPGSGLILTSRLSAAGGYQARLEVTVENTSNGRQQHALRVALRQGQASADTYNPHRALCHLGADEGVDTFELDDTEDGPVAAEGAVGWIAVDRKYFLQALVASDLRGTCEVSRAAGESLLVNTFLAPVVALEAGEKRRYEFGVYLGAKEQSALRDFDVVSGVALEDAVDWGWFGGMSRTLGQWMLELLRYFYRLTGVWGVAILLLTVVVKLVTLPLTLKQMSSMKRMREISPELEKIRKKYGQDRVKQQQEMQALFSRTGVNPLAGCFPALVQMPIWIALYAMLGTVVELYHEPFLWLPDLTRPDPLYALPVAMGALMFLQMRIQPMQPTQDPAQAKMMQWMMPAFFTFMILFVPSGLGVYIFSNV